MKKLMTIMLFLILMLSVTTSYAAGTGIVTAAENGGKLVSKTVNLPNIAIDKNAKGTHTAIFNFHAPDKVTADYTKNASTLIINPNPLTLNYSKTELHGTTGSAAFDATIGSLTLPNNKQCIWQTTKVTGAISPGENKNVPVSIEAKTQDPFIFSDDPTDEPHFLFDSGGLDYSFSLLAGTMFPEIFAPDMDSFGAIASDTQITFSARVAAGVFSDPETFFDLSIGQDVIDLFTLTITSDENHAITAMLNFGATTSNFTINSPTDIASIEQNIAAGFLNGAIMSNLEDLFTVGFVPDSSVSKMTFGTSTLVDFGAVEVPEPATICLLSLGGLTLLRRKK